MKKKGDKSRRGHGRKSKQERGERRRKGMVRKTREERRKMEGW